MRGKFLEDHLQLGHSELFFDASSAASFDKLEELAYLRLCLGVFRKNDAQLLHVLRLRSATMVALLRLRFRHSQGRRVRHDIAHAVLLLEDPTGVIRLHLLNDFHPNLEVLDQHRSRILVSLPEWHNHVCMLHCWLDEVIVGRLYEAIILS